jgi:hypothetical protein
MRTFLARTVFPPILKTRYPLGFFGAGIAEVTTYYDPTLSSVSRVYFSCSMTAARFTIV